MLEKDKEKARELRKTGMSYREIGEIFGCHRSSIARCSQDIVLNEEQKRLLLGRANRGKSLEIHRKKREEYQQKGRELAKTLDPVFIAGCMLYWGEGSKNRHVSIVNCDANLLKFFLDFLRTYFDIEEDRITIRVAAYLNNGVTEEEIKSYWLDLLKLPASSLRKCKFWSSNESRKSWKGRKRHIYGQCWINYCDVRVSQTIYGAIQEFCKFDNIEWLFDNRSNAFLHGMRSFVSPVKALP